MSSELRVVPDLSEEATPPDKFPPPELLALLEPFLRSLMYAAIDYDANAVNGELTSAAEFVDCLRVDVERAAAHRNLIRPGR